MDDMAGEFSKPDSCPDSLLLLLGGVLATAGPLFELPLPWVASVDFDARQRGAPPNPPRPDITALATQQPKSKGNLGRG